MAVSVGCGHMVAVSTDGACFSCGLGEDGQLGTGEDTRVNRLTRAHVTVDGQPVPVRQVSCGLSHTAFVSDTGDVLVCGWGNSGQLGVGDIWPTLTVYDNKLLLTPTPIDRSKFGGESVLMVACGELHTAVVTESGAVFTFGCGMYGKLGHGNQQDHLEPKRVSPRRFNHERVVMVATGEEHTVALTEDGHVFCWGSSEYGQLGLNTHWSYLTPTQVHPSLFGDERVVFIAASFKHTAAVTERGRLYTFGRNDGGQLGQSDNQHRWVPELVPGGFGGSEVVTVACGREVTLALTRKGELWASGSNRYHQLGSGAQDNTVEFQLLRREAFDGAMVVAISAGYSQAAAVTDDGHLWAWGVSNFGTMGLGHFLTPTRVVGAEPDSQYFGRLQTRLPATHKLAVAMGMHNRIGAGSIFEMLQGKDELIHMILDRAQIRRWIDGEAGEQEGTKRLLGGI